MGCTSSSQLAWMSWPGRKRSRKGICPLLWYCTGVECCSQGHYQPSHQLACLSDFWCLGQSAENQENTDYSQLLMITSTITLTNWIDFPINMQVLNTKAKYSFQPFCQWNNKYTLVFPSPLRGTCSKQLPQPCSPSWRCGCHIHSYSGSRLGCHGQRTGRTPDDRTLDAGSGNPRTCQHPGHMWRRRADSCMACYKLSWWTQGTKTENKANLQICLWVSLLGVDETWELKKGRVKVKYVV